jgi:hypothetical protein
MERVNCPLCKVEVVLVHDRAAWFELGAAERLIAPHVPGPQAVLNGVAVRHVGSSICLASGCSVPFAESVAEDRAVGLHLMAHP